MLQGLRVVVVEDEALVALSVISELRAISCNVVGDATNGVEAVELCRRLLPDLVIMDINLPEMDGIEASRIISEELEIPIIIVSGYSDESLIKEATSAGVINYLIKPVTKHNLRAAIEVAFKNLRNLEEEKERNTRLIEELQERKLIERAKGILMELSSLTEQKAMDRLKELSNNRNEKMVEVAKQIINAKDIFMQD